MTQEVQQKLLLLQQQQHSSSSSSCYAAADDFRGCGPGVPRPTLRALPGSTPRQSSMGVGVAEGPLWASPTPPAWLLRCGCS